MRIWREWIASTPIEAFQRELLEKAKGYKLTDALAEGRRFEAILPGRQEIQKRTSTPLNNVDQVGQACGNCGRAHPPRACPAYKDSCKFGEKIGHWKKFCRKRKGTNRPKEDVQQRGNTKSDGKQHRDAILQDGQPVAFASKALNSAQSSYPNTDREMLAVVFGINRFHTYLYGRPFRVITDHKPLEMISNKPLLRAPPRLQRMLQKIQGYDFTIEYRQGKTMTLADTLSRLPNPKDKGTVELDLRVDGIEMTTAEVHRCDVDLVNFSQRKQHQLRDQTARDPTMNALMETMIQGWPDSIKDLPTDVRVFWSFREELAVEDGIIFKGKQVLIPESLRADILAQLHQSHQGIEKTQLLAREGCTGQTSTKTLNIWPGPAPCVRSWQTATGRSPSYHTTQRRPLGRNWARTYSKWTGSISCWYVTISQNIP